MRNSKRNVGRGFGSVLSVHTRDFRKTFTAAAKAAKATARLVARPGGCRPAMKKLGELNYKLGQAKAHLDGQVEGAPGEYSAGPYTERLGERFERLRDERDRLQQKVTGKCIRAAFRVKR